MKLVFGVGINDADYVVKKMEFIGGKRKLVWFCPFYMAWKSMMARCYSPKLHEKYPTYVGCIVCAEWLTFSNFRRWMEVQTWEGRQLDKDILISGNKVYGPEHCVFVDPKTNSFLTDRGAARGEWPIGVTLDRRIGNLEARCSNPFTGKREHLGLFTDPASAHEAWRKRKHELAAMLAEKQADERVAAALRTRFL
ncbi:hypothetical protein UFOVP150_37 [uncultured Caudovirales phage]|uniref:Uncharacterized protein n=1 Tax=uncultured Caudovirales phage TaxID=2100421 RepID=A0A6J7WAT5_9CAUD|nr:hypothetical protein UFOVP150_37 [uncultured Caudovirales phage]